MTLTNHLQDRCVSVLGNSKCSKFMESTLTVIVLIVAATGDKAALLRDRAGIPFWTLKWSHQIASGKSQTQMYFKSNECLPLFVKREPGDGSIQLEGALGVRGEGARYRQFEGNIRL